ncbi:hypothetical protein EYF80_063531 [Liparis tanakae]|uniref:Uncharacterized protein n=1 Tax=Liparis tanakae TaxID=230148 RepID=A0A4Z2EDH5_9TELE|nr:hypothetical protein EYF80_063531 [Liparis tanakae]
MDGVCLEAPAGPWKSDESPKPRGATPVLADSFHSFAVGVARWLSNGIETPTPRDASGGIGRRRRTARTKRCFSGVEAISLHDGDATGTPPREIRGKQHDIKP